MTMFVTMTVFVALKLKENLIEKGESENSQWQCFRFPFASTKDRQMRRARRMNKLKIKVKKKLFLRQVFLSESNVFKDLISFR